MGGNVEKGGVLHLESRCISVLTWYSSDVQVDWQFYDPWVLGGYGGISHFGRKVGHRRGGRSSIYQGYVDVAYVQSKPHRLTTEMLPAGPYVVSNQLSTSKTIDSTSVSLHTATRWCTTSSTARRALPSTAGSRTRRASLFLAPRPAGSLCRSHIRKLTSEHNCPMPVIDAAHGHLLTARALNGNLQRKGTSRFETLDWSALIAGTRVAAGLDGFDSSKVGVDLWLLYAC